jgi:hypothetical protein
VSYLGEEHRRDRGGKRRAARAIALPGITILHFRGDRVVERFSQADMLGLLIQAGAVPAPA